MINIKIVNCSEAGRETRANDRSNEAIKLWSFECHSSEALWPLP